MKNIQYKYGGNGKVALDKEKSIATKTLKDPRNHESKRRFLKELDILKDIREKNIDNIVEIIDIDPQKLELKMPLYNGDLTSIYSITTGNVKVSLSLILPVITALKKLSSIETPIYHRDLKPANILVRNEGNDYKLYVADFGCAYLKEESVRRDTPHFRAVGAQRFRAPEYEYGRVEEITEKGDVFSLGKIIWCMLNGVSREVFPYTLWFPNEYNLENRFPNDPLILKANLIIAACVDIESSNRPNYDTIIEMIENILSDSNIENPDVDLMYKTKKFEAIRKVKEKEFKSLTMDMLNIFYIDINESLILADSKFKNFELISHLRNEFYDSYNRKDSSIEHKLKNDTESYIFSTSFRNIYVSFNYHSSYSNSNPSENKELPYISCDYIIKSSSKFRKLQLFYDNNILSINDEDGIKTYTKSSLFNFISKLIEDFVTVEI